MLATVPQRTIKPVIEAAVAKDTLVHTDEYGIFARRPAWGYRHMTVCHICDEYDDGFCEVHFDTMEARWSLLCSWLRQRRDISQDKSPLHLSFFQFVHNAR